VVQEAGQREREEVAEQMGQGEEGVAQEHLE
jgi:hypothetical protein